MTNNALLEIVSALLELRDQSEDNNILNIRGGRGYAAGHPYPKKTDRPGYGVTDAPGKELKDTQDNGPVAVSRAYKGE
jgi:hypothetical protein